MRGSRPRWPRPGLAGAVRAASAIVMGCPPTVSFCAAVDGAGNVLTSTEPTGPAPAWRHVNVDSGGGLTGIICRSASFCLAFGSLHDSGGPTGAIFSSSHPTGGPNAWKVAQINTTSTVAGSCPSDSLCVLGDVTGDVVTSTDPMGGSDAWSVAKVDSRSFTGVSCPTISLCVGVDEAGRVLTSVDPTGGASAWQTYGSEDGIPNATGIPGTFDDVSCASAQLCVAVDFLGNVATSKDPAGAAADWHSVHIDGGNNLHGVSCAPQGKLCSVTDDVHTVLTATNPISARSAWPATRVGVARYASSPISCPTVSLCVALADEYPSTGTGSGQIAIGTNAGTRAARWTYGSSVFPPGQSGASVSPSAIGCASRTLCVAFASYVSCGGEPLFCYQTGPVEAATTTNPADGSSAWRVAAIQRTQTDRVVNSVSCPTTRLCVAADSSGQVLVSINPSASTWSSFAIDNVPGGLSSVSCATARMCAAVDAGGNVLISTKPAAGTPWKETHLTDHPLTGIACPAVSLCIAVDSNGYAHISTRPTGEYRTWSQADIDNANTFNSLTAIHALTSCFASPRTAPGIRSSA